MRRENGKGRQGFASMKPEIVRTISSLGGKAAHAKGTAHEWTREEAQAAGKKGGLATHASRPTAYQARPA